MALVMGVYKTKTFARFARKAELDDGTLHRAALEVMAGRYEADLGGGVVKKRVARTGAGKSGGFRTLVAFQLGRACFFVAGFAKNQKSDLSPRELRATHDFAALLLGFNAGELSTAIAAGQLIQLEAEQDDKSSRSIPHPGGDS